ncbi:hypothetical protein [Paraburkholderia sp.]|uniref:hypothetical protein n=1 Tax=Paraburkholderia sp. TaxID=1926495 RepID=UPI002391D59F|nr:hypothetical protein [Paraburkholderia sp.]MDE1183508.1 hypothetical protein [Paraburkholderia sp.]
MKRLKLLLAVPVAAALCASGAAQAARVGVYIGGGVPYYYPVAPVPYYYGPPPVVVQDAEPQEYIEQGQPQGPAQQPGVAADPQAASAGTWYYCDASKTYYPYVKTCQAGWREVPAQPPAPSN